MSPALDLDYIGKCMNLVNLLSLSITLSILIKMLTKVVILSNLTINNESIKNTFNGEKLENVSTKDRDLMSCIFLEKI